MGENLLYEVTVDVNETKSIAGMDIVIHFGFKQRGFTGTGTAQYIYMVKPVVEVDAKSVPLITKVGLGKVTYWVVVVETHPHIVTSLLVLQRWGEL
jgi:hypothetical protein